MLVSNGAPPVVADEAPTQQLEPAEPSRTLTVRAPEDDQAREVGARVTVSPGGRATLIAHVRNESDIVDSYELRVTFRYSGDPEEQTKPRWYVVAPQRIYLMPLGDGSFELDAQIELHPPRTPEARAGEWQLTITAISSTRDTKVGTAFATLIIEPYADVDYVVSPHMARGRLGAPFVAAIGNRANATADVELLLVGEEEGLRFEGGTRRLTWRALGLALAPFIARARKDATKGAAKQLKPPPGAKEVVPKDAAKELSKGSSQAGKAADAKIAAADGAATRGGPELPQPVVRTLPVGGDPDTVPFVVRPERQIWIGRPAYRRFTVSARVAGDDAPVVPRYAVYRQRPWLPWWLAILIPLIAIGVALYLALKPKMVVVPNLVGAKSTFAAQEMLQPKGLMLNPDVQAQTSSKPAGSVIGQTPKPNASVKKGSLVSILIAAGSGLATVPQLKGKTVKEADQILTKAGLTLGMVLPTPKPNGVIGNQIPGPGLKRKDGTPVNVFLKPPHHPSGSGTTTSTTKTGSTPAGAPASGGGGGAATIAVPKPAGATLTKYEAMLTKAGLKAGSATWMIDTAPLSTVIATDPAAGTKVKAGTAVKTTASAGFPNLAFDDGGGIVVLHGYTGAPVARLGEASDTSPTWSPDGKTIVDTTGPVLLATDMKHPKKAPAQLTAAAPGVTWTNPTFAPTTAKHLLAVIRHDSGPDSLCFLLVAKPPKGSPGCLAVPGWKLSEIAWSPDGRSMLVSASSLTTSGTFGLLRFVATVPFAASPTRWSTNGALATPTASGQGVLAAQISPDGASMAVISSLGTGSFRVGLTKPKDLAMKKLKLLPLRGCDVAWRSDSKELAIVQSDPFCSAPMGSIVGLDPSKPRDLRMIAFSGEHPSWQPVRLGP
jgi:beta-lactam-binding protein with PASTA domain